MKYKTECLLCDTVILTITSSLILNSLSIISIIPVIQTAGWLIGICMTIYAILLALKISKKQKNDSSKRDKMQVELHNWLNNQSTNRDQHIYEQNLRMNVLQDSYKALWDLHKIYILTVDGHVKSPQKIKDIKDDVITIIKSNASILYGYDFKNNCREEAKILDEVCKDIDKDTNKDSSTVKTHAKKILKAFALKTKI